MDNWGGAQWVLSTWLVLTVVFFPLVIRMSGVTFGGRRRAAAPEWFGWFLSKVSDAVVLVLILWWGGFWA